MSGLKFYSTTDLYSSRELCWAPCLYSPTKMAILIHFVDPKESDDDAVPPELRCLGALRHGHRCLVHRYRCSLQRCDFCVMASILAWCSGLGGHLGIAPWEKRLGLIPLWWNCMNAWVSGKIEKRQIEHDLIHCLACSWLFNYCRPILHQCDFDQTNHATPFYLNWWRSWLCAL